MCGCSDSLTHPPPTCTAHTLFFQLHHQCIRSVDHIPRLYHSANRFTRKSDLPSGWITPKNPAPSVSGLARPKLQSKSIHCGQCPQATNGTGQSVHCSALGSKRQNKKAKRPLTDRHPCNKDFRGSCRRSLSHHQSHQRDLSDNVKPSGNRSKSGTWPQQPLSQDLVKTASDLG